MLDGLEIEIFKLVSRATTPEQWAEWLRVPLEHATAQGNHGLVGKLLGAGANGSAGWKGCNGRTLLHAAAVGGSEGVVSSLLRAGAQPDVNVLLPAPSSRSPLYLAASGGHEAAARLLIHAGADVNFEDPRDKRSVLHEALRRGHGRLAELLIMSGADVEARDSSGGGKPLHLAASKGLDEVVSVLLLRGVDKDALDDHGSSALMFACGEQGAKPHLGVAETLLAAGADVSIRCQSGFTAFHWSSVTEDPPTVPLIEALIRHGADVDAQYEGYTALHDAAENDFVLSIDALIEAGANMEVKTLAGDTPLSVAARACCAKSVLALLRKGAVANARNNEGKTPLHLACDGWRGTAQEAVEILMGWGADETALDNDGKSPGDVLDGAVGSRTFTQDHIDRIRLLLARAPADRAWRRRGWLTMLRSRDLKFNTDTGGDGAEGSDGAGGGASESRRHVARSEDAVDVGGGEGGQANSGGGGVENGGVRGGGEDRVLRGVVVRLVGLEPEGVFRRVLEFL